MLGAAADVHRVAGRAEAEGDAAVGVVGGPQRHSGGRLTLGGDAEGGQRQSLGDGVIDDEVAGSLDEGGGARAQRDRLMARAVINQL